MTDPITTPAQMREAAADACKKIAEERWRQWKLFYEPNDQGKSLGADLCEEAIRAIPCVTELESVADLRRQLAEAALEVMAAEEQAANAYGAQLRAEAERDALKAEVAKLIPHAPHHVAQCHGARCREPWCASCNGWEEAMDAIKQIKADFKAARAAMEGGKP